MQYGREVNQLNMLVEAEQKKNVEDKLAELDKIPSTMVDFNARANTDLSGTFSFVISMTFFPSRSIRCRARVHIRNSPSKQISV